MSSSHDDRISRISKTVKKKLNCFSERSNYQCIFKFLLTQRKENEEAYEPEMLSIGPYHHGKSKCQKLEMYKLEYLREIHRRDNQCLERCIKALMAIEWEARNCYSRDAGLIKNGAEEEYPEADYCFVEMMLLDGCFIVEFLRKYSTDKKKVKDDDPVFKIKWLVEILCRDMLLFENQLPFFVLHELFEITRINPDENLIRLAISCLNHCIAADNGDISEAFYTINQSGKCVYHLLSLMYDSWCSSFATGKFIETKQEEKEDEEEQHRPEFSVISLEKMNSNLLLGEDEAIKLDLEFIKTVSELEEDGVLFKKPEVSESWLHIKFKEGVMEIPALVVHDHTESILRNLIAFEEYTVDPRYIGKVVTDYTTLMNCLVNSSKDVQILRHMKVIKNLLGNDQVLSDMFNRLSSNIVSLNCPWFSYRKAFRDVNEHCSKRRNRWIADLKKKYFYSPWSITAFLAATVLLVLTLIQTIFTVH